MAKQRSVGMQFNSQTASSSQSSQTDASNEVSPSQIMTMNSNTNKSRYKGTWSNPIGSVVGSVVGGLFGLGQQAMENRNQWRINEANLAYKREELGFQKEMWNKEYSTARQMGLSHPSQIANPSGGGYGSLIGNQLTMVPRSPFPNVFN